MSVDIARHAPDSPLSQLSQLSSSPPQLDPATLALVHTFFAERDAAEQLLADRLAATAAEEAEASKGNSGEGRMLSVDEFRSLFGEDWQLSQFWYSTPFATRLAKFLRPLCTPTSVVAFLCCPTGFVAFQNEHPRLPETRLLEFDRRFARFAGSSFVEYDLDEPDRVPQELVGTVDIAVVDPPFLNEITNRKLAQTLSLLLKPTGRLLVITSTSVGALSEIYAAPPLGPLRPSGLDVEHAGGLANDFACWSSWDVELEGKFVFAVDESARRACERFDADARTTYLPADIAV